MTLPTARDILGIKTGFRLLVESVGGLEAASAALGGYPTGRIAEAYLPANNRAPRADHVAILEAIGGTPFVTAALARLSGHVLATQAGQGGGCETRAVHLAMARMGEAIGCFHVAVCDGDLDPAERAELRRRAAEAQREIGAFLASGDP